MSSATSRRRLLQSAGWLLSTTAMGSIGALAPALAQEATRKVTLDVQMTERGPAYNGLSPGPTIRANPGDTIDVDFINSLPPLHDDCTNDPNNFHGRNTTNLHTHGLHVSPSTDSSGTFDADNVFVSVVPNGQIVPCEEICGEEVGTTFRWGQTKYRFELGDAHNAGTNWYHAHKHGSTASQVGGGLSGPLIIDDAPGAMPAYIEQANEKILMIMNRGLVLVNPEGGGTADPTLSMRPGEVQRWRVINALGNATDYSILNTHLPDLEMYMIAFDGFTLNKRIEVDQTVSKDPWHNPAALASGNRADFIVRAPLDGAGTSSSSGMFARLRNPLGAQRAKEVSVEVNISGTPVNMLWSEDDNLPGPGLDDIGAKTLQQRTINFTPRIGIDRELYDGQIKQSMTLGTAEEWTIRNTTAALHVYHIHVNPFFVTHINGQELPADSPLRRWQDTIGVPPRDDTQPGTVTYRTRFETFKGKFVIHCHVLRHEDQGMMQTVEVI